MVNGYWYYPTNKYESGRDKDIDSDETSEYYDERIVYDLLTTAIIQEGNKNPKSITKRKRDLIIQLFDRRCNRCSKPEDLQIHHKNRNRKDNTIENLEVICYACHKLEHAKRIPVG